MKSVMLWALGVLNVVLLAVVVDRHMKDSTAHAAAGRLGQVLAVPGNLPGGNNGVVFVLDTTNRQLSAITFDGATGRVTTMPPLDIQRVLDNAGGVGPRRGK